MATIEQLTLERDRLTVRAKELQRQRMTLENELASSGISEAERDYLQQRIKLLSTDEDALGQKLAKVEPQLAQLTTQATQFESQRRRFIARAQTPAVGQTPQQLQAIVRTRQSHDARETQYESFGSRIRRSGMLVIVGVLAVAGIADLLSLIDVGWVASWLIPIVSWFIVRRVTGMRTVTSDIAGAQQEATHQIRILRQRLGMASSDLPSLNEQAKSYVVTFVSTQLVAQSLELIPVLDWLPMYLGSVVKILFDQHKAYRTAQAALALHRQTLDALIQLEEAEVTGILPAAPIPIPARPIPAVRPVSVAA